MNFTDIQILACKFGASATQRTFNGEETIMVTADELPSTDSGVKAWSKGIFITKNSGRWTIGFGQTEKVENLKMDHFKKLLITWLEEPSDEILRNYAAT